ncbi:MAG: transcriptional regulator [Thermodesulfobacteriota bacterium]
METTKRQQIIALLEQETLSSLQLSPLVSLSEKEVVAHLPHIERSLKGGGKRLTTVAARCLDCGHLFRDRQRFGKPGRCPRCRGSHIEPPRFRIESDKKW